MAPMLDPQSTLSIPEYIDTKQWSHRSWLFTCSPPRHPSKNVDVVVERSVSDPVAWGRVMHQPVYFIDNMYP